MRIARITIALLAAAAGCAFLAGCGSTPPSPDVHACLAWQNGPYTTVPAVATQYYQDLAANTPQTAVGLGMRQTVATFAYGGSPTAQTIKINVNVDALYRACHALGVRWPGVYLHDGTMPDGPPQ